MAQHTESAQDRTQYVVGLDPSHDFQHTDDADCWNGLHSQVECANCGAELTSCYHDLPTDATSARIRPVTAQGAVARPCPANVDRGAGA